MEYPVKITILHQVTVNSLKCASQDSIKTCDLFFRAFDIHHRGLLSYKDVLLGLSAMEPATPHGGTPAEMRCRYIFRFYDKNGDGLLQFQEYR